MDENTSQDPQNNNEETGAENVLPTSDSTPVQPDNTMDFQNRNPLEELRAAATSIREELAKIIIGQQEFIELLIVALLSDGHVLIEGVPGIAKTVTAKLFARTLDTQFGRIQFTPDLMPSDVLGTSILNMKTSEFEFKPGPIFSNICLLYTSPSPRD